MIGINFALCFVLCALAVWRVAHLLAGKNNSSHLSVRLRTVLESSVFGRVMGSFYGWSVLLSLLPAIWMSSGGIGFLVQWIALPGFAYLLEKITQMLQRRLYISRVSKEHLDKIIRGV
jgi:hypothetical protein